MLPVPRKSCGPYRSTEHFIEFSKQVNNIDADNHDTIGIVAIDVNGNVASGASTNGLAFKIPG